MARRTFGKIRELPSGMWQASFIGPDGVRYKAATTFAHNRKGSAEEWLNKERRYMEDHTPAEWIPPTLRGERKKLPSLSDYADQWLKADAIRETTRVQYERHLRLRIKPDLGEMRLNEITKKDVKKWWDSMPGNRASDQAYALLRTIMNAAVDEDLIKDNPCTVKGAGLGSKKRKIDPPTPEQVQAIADNMPPQWRIGVLIAAWCFLRSGEVRELRRKDIEIAPDGSWGIIHVTQAVARAGNELIYGDPKSDAGIRDAAIPKALIPAVQSHLALCVGEDPESLLICNADGSTVDDRVWGPAFKRACVLALAPQSAWDTTKAKWEARGRKGRMGIPAWKPPYTFHDLRHIGLTNLAIGGATLKELQTAAGHTTPEMAMRYQEIAGSHYSEVVDRLSDMIPDQSA